MAGAARLIVAAPALFLLAYAAIFSHRFGTSAAAAYYVSTQMANGPTSDASQSQKRAGWDLALRSAAAEAPTDPSIQELLAMLALGSSRSDDSASEAIDRITRALQQRPTSPYSWANLVQALYRKGEIGARFEAALQTAAETGPWEPEVERKVADYGLAVWGEISPSTRSAVERMVANGMAHQATEILQISGRRGRLSVACAYLGRSKRTDPKWVQLCQSTGSR
jgi:predicted Zn-dependent protease